MRGFPTQGRSLRAHIGLSQGNSGFGRGSLSQPCILHSLAKHSGGPSAEHSPPGTAQSHRRDACPCDGVGSVGSYPDNLPEGHTAAAGQAAARLSIPNRCRANKRSDRHSKITSSSRGRDAGDWLLVWPEKCLQRKGVSLAETSSAKCWAGHWLCSAGARAAQPSGGTLCFAGSGPLIWGGVGGSVCQGSLCCGGGPPSLTCSRE